jgi:transcriptional regulator with XRE-family HTH domain
MKGQFNEKIPAHREQQHLSLRQVAALLERRTAQLSKIEKGLRQSKWEQIALLSDWLKADKNELLIPWLPDKLFNVAKDEKFANEDMQSTEKKKLIFKNASNNGSEKHI